MSTKNRTIIVTAIALCVVIAAILTYFKVFRRTPAGEQEVCVAEEIELKYGLPCRDYTIEYGTVQSGQTLSSILNNYGIGPGTIDRVAKTVEPVFSLRNIKAGNHYAVFLAADSLSADSLATLRHFVYESSLTDYLVISLEGDSVSAVLGRKDVQTERCRARGTIESSLWNAMVGQGLPPSLAMELSEIYAWSVDFFGLQQGDQFNVIYDRLSVDSLMVGVGTIWGAEFLHAGKTYYAIPFMQGEKVTYWDENGASLRKTLLKAPLRFSRISSRFTASRMHPVLKVRRAHYAVDYAAPSGTPVHSVADGVILSAGWSGGGGNTVKIRHANNLQSAYLHLKGYASGIKAGKRVSQGDLIGYVGSTGLSTGPHLDFRLWRGNQPIDPLKAPSDPVEPISEQNKAAFGEVKSRILGELADTLPDSLRITSLTMLSCSPTEE